MNEQPRPNAIRLSTALVSKIVAHARAAVPRECCGLLVGTIAEIDECVPSVNVDPDPSRFRVDPATHIDLNRRLRGTGRAVVGVYHSHPRGLALPSASDIAEALYPEFVHVIVAGADRPSPDVRAYRIINNSVTPVAIEEGSAGESS